jgi:hypothetical protein
MLKVAQMLKGISTDRGLYDRPECFKSSDKSVPIPVWHLPF